MPRSDLHKKQKTKNYALMAMLFGLVALFWVLTIIKLKNGV